MNSSGISLSTKRILRLQSTKISIVEWLNIWLTNMASEYKLKKNPLDSNRISKLLKDLSTKSKEDRKLALEVYNRYARNDDPSAQKTSVEALKLAQSSKEADIKILSLILKFKEFENSGNKDEGDKTPDNFFDDEDDE